GEIGSPELEGAARARLPAAAVRGNERGKRPDAGGQIKIAEERNAIMGGVGDPAAGFDRLRCGHCLSFLARGHSVGRWLLPPTPAPGGGGRGATPPKRVCPRFPGAMGGSGRRGTGRVFGGVCFVGD